MLTRPNPSGALHLQIRKNTPDVTLRVLLNRLAPSGIAVAIAVFLLAPRAAAGTLVILAALLGLPSILDGRRDRLWPLSLVMFLIAGFGAYLVVNALWAVDRSEAYGKVLFFAVAAILSWLAIVGLSQLTREHL